MRLTKNSISFVKTICKDGIRYSTFVKLKDGDYRQYIHYEDGKTVATQLHDSEFPKCVNDFIYSHKPHEEIFHSCEWKGSLYTHFIYQ